MSDTKVRASWLTIDQQFALDDACRVLNAAFRDDWGFGAYHVGSSLTRRDYHDVDVRFIMHDEAFQKVFGGKAQYPVSLQFLNVAISTWLAKRSGLPIDFQFQSQTQANAFDGPRSAVGRALRYDGREW